MIGTSDDLPNTMISKTLIVDSECFTDFFSVSFLEFRSGTVEHHIANMVDALDRRHVRRLLKRNRIVTFNGNNYDVAMISLALAGLPNSELKRASDDIIVTGYRPWQIERRFEVPLLKLPDHIDLIEVAPGIASLKIYGGRMHAPIMRDLPFHPEDLIGNRVDTVLEYTENDLNLTAMLYRQLLPQLKLRRTMSKQYNIDLMSKSDAQIAETVITSELESKVGFRLQKPKFEGGFLFRYEAPDFIKFHSKQLITLRRNIEADEFIVADGSGKILLPKSLRRKQVKIDGNAYRLGIGGLHSCEKSVSYVAADDEFILDFDVTSYYPAIIMKCGLYPSHLGKSFLDVYAGIVAERIHAKETGDKVRAESLKITVNGSFGKFGSRYSMLYSPKLLIQTTITGQLALLMLIERIQASGGEVISANTDGLMVRVKRKHSYKIMKSAIGDWETDTGFNIEETQYSSVHLRDVNNYVAIKPDGTHKGKGIFATEAKGTSLAKSPVNHICITAVVDYLSTGKAVADTIAECENIAEFISIRTVKGGAIWKAETIGQAIRWYYSKQETGALHYHVNGNKVPRTDGARPIMNMPPDHFPDDLNRQWYVREAEEILSSIGAGMI